MLHKDRTPLCLRHGLSSSAPMVTALCITIVSYLVLTSCAPCSTLVRHTCATSVINLRPLHSHLVPNNFLTHAGGNRWATCVHRSITGEHGSERCVFVSFVNFLWQHAGKGRDCDIASQGSEIAITLSWRMVAQRYRRGRGKLFSQSWEADSLTGLSMSICQPSWDCGTAARVATYESV